MTAAPISREAYLARERLVGGAVNAVLSVAFFLLVFGVDDAVFVWAPDHLALDGLPQSFMIGFLGTLVPSLIARRARAHGGIVGVTAAPQPIAPLVLRSAMLGAAAAIVGGGGIAALLWASGIVSIPFVPALAAKAAYGVLLGIVLTPIAVKRVLA